LALDRSPRGAEPAPGLGGRVHSDVHRDVYYVPPVRRGQHRNSAPASPWHGRAAIAAVAAGATAAAAYSLVDLKPTEQYAEIAKTASGALIQSTPAAPKYQTKSAAFGGRHYTRETPELAAMDSDTDVADVQSLTKAVKVGEQLANQALKLKNALAGGAPEAAIFDGTEFVKPTTGTFTSGFGGRWGVTHYGIDLANKIGTPIYAVTDGTVISSGPASGFGLWVRLLHPGGWISVYGHINRSLVRVGEKVKAGQQIAEMGNRGQSTGPHLHFEIWDPSGKKLNPLPWLAARGIHVTGNPSHSGSE
jgi:murein DD-endopeptidase MepM/ murein hydrolase activator NlpD